MILPSKHLIVSLENSKMLWYLAIVPDENAFYDKGKTGKADDRFLTKL